MKTRTQFLLGVLGLSLVVGLPVLAQTKPGAEALESTPSAVEETPSAVEEAPSAVEEQVPTTPNPATPEQEKPTSAEAAPTGSSLVDKASSAKEFQTLAKAIKAAGLEETLAGQGPYTIFAPTDEAFAALPPGILDQLLQPDNKEILVSLLKSHVVSGAVTSQQIQSGNVETLAGVPVAIQRGEDGSVTVNNAKVTQADIEASNGVIHAIDQVILPQEAAQSETTPKPMSKN
jgi:uncharacterized surface protein with fasciclin (FAS1) repeats